MWLQHKFVRPPTQTLQNDINKKPNYCRLGLSLPALGDEDRKNMFAAMDENGDGTIHKNIHHRHHIMMIDDHTSISIP